MSALGLSALGLASRTAQLQPALYAELANRSPAFDVLTLESGGYTEAGKGAARYVADALADAALVAAHPRFAFTTANSRHFRLLPDAGALSVEQGGATGGGAVDDRDAIQAAIDYAESIEAREVRFEAARYRVECPLRSSPALATRAEDGHPLVVRKSLSLRGCAATRTVLDFRAHGGGDPDTDWQVVAKSSTDATPAVWRGGGLYIQGDSIRPEPAARRIARLELDRLVFNGNRSRTGTYTYPADPVTGDGWDITDKGFWLQDVYVGEVICRDTDFIGWRGEIFYAVGADDAIEQLTLTRCRMLTGNGNGLNLGCDPVVTAEDCEFGDCKIAQEDTGKRRGHFRNCLWRDCEYVWIGGGSTNGRLYSYKYPTRDELAPVPSTQLQDCRFEDCGLVWVNSWVSGRIRTVDTTVALSTTHGQALRDVDLEIDAWLDRGSGIHAFALYGPASLTDPVEGAPAGIYRQPPKSIRAEVRHFRSALAQEAGREWLGILWTGYLDRSCRIQAEGEFGNARSPNGMDDPLSFPFVRFDGGNATTAYTAHGFYKVATLSAAGVLKPAGPAMAVSVASEVDLPMTLPGNPRGGAAYGYADGQVLRIVKQYDTGSVTFTKGASANMAMLATRVLDRAFDWVEFSYNRTLARWEECGFGAYG
ncbi:hypothetical protein [Qipengyuania soli]|uniref:Pectate lyase superfamily protein domain-containing protein n=1 Tax=Qipengyuania soli TaxID=2782568 RepID=A0A7S8F4Q4_9SPHN|nr:hypothetical protein [Qipengyuania soli]QPC98968.1 hypothetical protein IRL76_14245 [Qipengyuania soli]